MFLLYIHIILLSFTQSTKKEMATQLFLVNPFVTALRGWVYFSFDGRKLDILMESSSIMILLWFWTRAEKFIDALNSFSSLQMGKE